VKFRLRKWDYHKDLEPYFNDYINTTKESLNGMKSSVAEVEDALKGNKIDKAKNILEKLKREIAKYKLS